jgi:DNA-binding transcriptional LysR family regulator
MDRFASIAASVRVAESGGFTTAARRLDLSTTTVSDQVQALENALGVRLLNRTTRQVILTEIGREYYERCAQILHELEEANEAAGALQVTPRGQLRVYCQKGVGPFIAPVVTGFLSQYPEVSVDLRDGDTMIDLVQERFDLAIMPVSPPDSTLVRRTLAKWHPLLCCAPAYLEKHPEPRSPADLVGHNCLLYAYTPFRDRWPFLDTRGNTLMARVPATLVTTSITVLRAVAVAGLGLWLSAPFIVSDLLASKELVPLVRDYRLPEMEIVALYPHRRHLTAKVRAFLDMLVDQFSNAQRRLAAASG